jgi:hypothetical protein
MASYRPDVSLYRFWPHDLECLSDAADADMRAVWDTPLFAYTVRDVADWLAAPRVLAVIARDVHLAPAGWGLAMGMPAGPARLVRVAVIPSWRRAGVGLGLVRYLLKGGWKRMHARIPMALLPGPAALLKAAGFRASHVIPARGDEDEMVAMHWGQDAKALCAPVGGEGGHA